MTDTAAQQTDHQTRLDRYYENIREEHRTNAAKRRAFREKLFGSKDEADWLAPPPLADFDALLAEHAAQLRNVALQVMGNALSDDHSLDGHVSAVGALTRVVQTNIAIAKVLGGRRADSKTVHGVSPDADPQE